MGACDAIMVLSVVHGDSDVPIITYDSATKGAWAIELVWKAWLGLAQYIAQDDGVPNWQQLVALGTLNAGDMFEACITTEAEKLLDAAKEEVAAESALFEGGLLPGISNSVLCPALGGEFGEAGTWLNCENCRLLSSCEEELSCQKTQTQSTGGA